jgi:hypothetical protein
MSYAVALTVFTEAFTHHSESSPPYTYRDHHYYVINGTNPWMSKNENDNNMVSPLMIENHGSPV